MKPHYYFLIIIIIGSVIFGTQLKGSEDFNYDSICIVEIEDRFEYEIDLFTCKLPNDRIIEIVGHEYSYSTYYDKTNDNQIEVTAVRSLTDIDCKYKD